MPFVNRDGARIHWRSDGDPARPALLVGNSLGSELGLWDPVLPALRRHFRVLRLDKRGHGSSETPPGEYTIEALARDALAVADASGAERFHYLGLSIGGMIGLWLGANAPERILRLVLCNTGAKMPAGIWDERIAKVKAGGMAAIVDAVMQRWFTARYLARADETFAGIRAAFLAVDPAGYVGCCTAIRDMDLRACSAEIRAPTLVTTSTHDLAAPKELGAAVAAEIRGARLVELPLAHIPIPESPSLFAQTVVPFLVGREVDTERERFDAGLDRRKEALGAAYVEERMRNVTPFNAEFQDLITRYAWGEIWTRAALDDRTRRLLVLAITTALGRWEEFRLHTRAGLAAELSATDVKEALMLCAIYCGVPSANSAFHHAAEALKEAG